MHNLTIALSLPGDICHWHESAVDLIRNSPFLSSSRVGFPNLFGKAQNIPIGSLQIHIWFSYFSDLKINLVFFLRWLQFDSFLYQHLVLVFFKQDTSIR